LAHEDYELGVDLRHFFEILIMEIQVVVNLLLGEDVLLYFLPIAEAQALSLL
jgi:hypothetical protein